MLKKQFYAFSKKLFLLRYHHIFDCWTVLDQGYLLSFQLESHHCLHHPVSHNLACKNLLSHQLNHQAMFLQLVAKKLVNLSVSFVVLKGLPFHFQLFFKWVQTQILAEFELVSIEPSSLEHCIQ